MTSAFVEKHVENLFIVWQWFQKDFPGKALTQNTIRNFLRYIIDHYQSFDASVEEPTLYLAYEFMYLNAGEETGFEASEGIKAGQFASVIMSSPSKQGIEKFKHESSAY